MFRALAFSFAAILALCIVGGTVWYFTPPPTTPTSPSERVSLAVPPGAVSVQQSRPQDVKLPAGIGNYFGVRTILQPLIQGGDLRANFADLVHCVMGLGNTLTNL